MELVVVNGEIHYEFCNEGQGGFASLGDGVTCTTYGSRLNRNYYESDSRVPILRSLQDAIDRQNELIDPCETYAPYDCCTYSECG